MPLRHSPALRSLVALVVCAIGAGAAWRVLAASAGEEAAAPRLRVLRDGPTAVQTATDIRYPFEAEISGGAVDDYVVVQWVRGEQCAPADPCFDTGGRWIVDNQTGDARGPAPGSLAEYPSLLGPWAERTPRAIRFRDVPGFGKGVPLIPGAYSMRLDFQVNVYSRQELGGEPRVEQLRSPSDPPPLLSQPWAARGAWTVPGGAG